MVVRIAAVADAHKAKAATVAAKIVVAKTAVVAIAVAKDASVAAKEANAAMIVVITTTPIHRIFRWTSSKSAATAL